MQNINEAKTRSNVNKVSDSQTHNKLVTNLSKNRSKLNTSTRPTKRFCQERLACKGNKPEAQFECRECTTFQCQVCEELLHENVKFVFHERRTLPKVAEELICGNNCENRNLADIECSDCNKKYCFVCDLSIHSTSAKRRHSRKPFEPKEPQEESEEFLSCLNVSDSVHKIKETENLITVDLDSDSDDNQSLLRSKYNETNNQNEIIKKETISSSERIACLPDIAQLSLDCPLNGPTHSPKTGMSVGVMQTTDGKAHNSFLLIDENELLQVTTSEEFAAKIGCDASTLIKVVSIFGNTGEGKSHTLNYTFFDGNELFKTSPTQNSCTIGIWCAFDPMCKVITIDTEGLLGISENNNRRTRLLLKVLAISDIIIYRTRAERLHNDLFTFLGDASRAYVQHFSKELRAASQRCHLSCPLSDLGPIVIIFHETLHTDILRIDLDLTPEDVIRQRFQRLGLSTEAFSAFEYVGTRTVNPPTNFKRLRETVKKHLKNSTVRSSRTSNVVFMALKLLNEKFSGDINKTVLSTFPDEYFSCSSHCLSCDTRCLNSMNHSRDGQPHIASGKCKYQHQFDNQIYFCKACNDRGESNMVIPKTSSSVDSAWMGIAKYAWSGFVLECKSCGIIYRSRQYWYGNKDPTEQTVVRTEIHHIWEGEPIPSHGSQNAAQRVVDSVNYISETVSTIGAKPSKMISSWVADQIAPSYWVPNARIQHCGLCGKEFEPLDHKHHCRSCGGGFCENCSAKSRPVPERGWGDQPVRVCNVCFDKGERSADSLNPEVTARKVGEVLQTTIGTVVSAIDYPLEWIKDSARPEYWIPDKDITACSVCKIDFSDKIAIHHCRACGQGVCDTCSQTRKPVPSRGWDQPVRTCDDCDKKMSIH